MPGYIASLTSSVRGDLAMRRAGSRGEAFRLARDLLVQAEAREAEKHWPHCEHVMIRIEADPERPEV
jgi:hypothetical protein